jgi:hypothetical protein
MKIVNKDIVFVLFISIYFVVGLISVLFFNVDGFIFNMFLIVSMLVMLATKKNKKINKWYETPFSLRKKDD